MVSLPILDISQLNLCDPSRRPLIQNLSLSLFAGQKVGLIGPSGCGKSLTSLAITGLLPDTLSQISGVVRFQGQNMAEYHRQQWQQIRGHKIFTLFQSPGNLYHPGRTLQRQLWDCLTARPLSDHQKQTKILAALAEMSLSPTCLSLYPHQLSGGMKQRCLLVMAFLLEPELIIADEITTGLDVLTEQEILNNLNVFLTRTQTACLFITHDLRILPTLCDSFYVMDHGHIVDRASFSEPGFSHPLTQSLFKASEVLSL